MDKATEATEAAVAKLDAVLMPDGDYAYRAEETGGIYRITEDEMRELGTMLLKAEACRIEDCQDEHHDAYSHWCAWAGEEIADQDHDALDAAAEAGLAPRP